MRNLSSNGASLTDGERRRMMTGIRSCEVVGYAVNGSVVCPTCITSREEITADAIFAITEFDEYPSCSRCSERIDCVSLTQEEEEVDLSEHAMVLQTQISSPYDGCMWEWQYLILLFDEECNMYRLVYNCWSGRHEGYVGASNRKRRFVGEPLDKDIVETEAGIKDLCKKMGISVNTYNLDDDDLYENVPDSHINGLCKISEMFEGEVKPFTWVCSECNNRQQDVPTYFGEISGNGGIGINFDNPLCEDCAPPEDERYY